MERRKHMHLEQEGKDVKPALVNSPQKEQPTKRSKYSQTERNQTKSLLGLYFESNLQNPNDKLHELRLGYLNKHGIDESSRKFLKEKMELVKELEKVKKDLAKYQKNKEC